MSKSSCVTRSGGLGTIEVLLIVFIVLKLCGLIQWSWIWVLSPLWILLAIVLLIFLVCAFIIIVGRIIAAIIGED